MLGDLPAVDDFPNLSGCGVRTNVGGHDGLVGTRRLLDEHGVPLRELAEAADPVLGRHLQRRRDPDRGRGAVPFVGADAPSRARRTGDVGEAPA